MKFLDPLVIHEQGRRDNNEDAFSFKEIDDETSCYVVCDGVGGEQKGEVASHIACKSVIDYMQKNNIQYPYKDYIQQMVDFINDEFNRHCLSEPSSRGMATTLTLLILYGGKAIIAHIGDSRVYHIRGSELLFQTRDHSLVNELVQNNIITKEEALHHPKRNVITRAIQGKSTQADIHVVETILPGDYFFLCSDGILESVDTELLIKTLALQEDDHSKIEKIRNYCNDHSKDNYTALLIPVR